MIEIHDKRDCTGCSACVQRCPVNCISFDTDSQGFLYPEVDKDRCIGCNLCEKVCPVINQGKERDDITVYAAKNRNQPIQMASSSGGVFFEIAKKIIHDGGIVFGARFDENWNVVHSYTDNIEGLKAFMSSKYSQSIIGDNYRKTEEFLKQGRTVLFSGTPCQIAGLKRFLMRDWGRRLVTVDVFCHGVPSPLVWSRYLAYLRENHGWDRISSVRFRDKSNGWNSYSVTIKGGRGN
ncbi:MAG: Coenzyme F420 hydrogenase/dehydrogenase, beta subunit C-terminal domain, partial [Muribaculaceae bacterium]|nr:Coenzyme F420 hydrogenase/dehydrogenase, beta subunit C-terminal domain [Muribaculaceae bacterium]